MKTILIIYGISWLILLIVYLYSLYQVRHGKSRRSNSKDPWYLYAIIWGLAPLAILVIPYVLIDDYREKKRKQKRDEEREQRKNEAERERRDAMENSQTARLLEDDRTMDDCRQRSARLMETIEKGDYEHILTVLDKVGLPSGMTFGVDECEQEGTGDESKLWVSAEVGVKDNEIFKYLKVEDSPSGAWQACLLYKLWHSLPFWWHGCYDRRIYLDNPDDCRKISTRDEKAKMIRKAIENGKDTRPHISRNGNKYYIERYYWNDWTGLARELVEVTIENKRVVKIIEVEKVVEYSYDCGILF